MRKNILIILFILSTLSILYGLIKLSKIGFDFQIDNARFLLKGRSPYDMYIKNLHLFKYGRRPTLLPQVLYILIPFSFFGDFLSGLLYGIIGIVFLYLCRFIKKENKNYIILFLLLLSTEPYRSNLSLGQSLFFYFPLFIVFDYLMKRKISKFFTLFFNPLILMLLFSKPSLSLWIPLYYGFSLKNIMTYIISFTMQISIIVIFSLQTKTGIFNFFTGYFKIVKEHMIIYNHPNNVFSINFSSLLQSITSYLIIILFLMISIIVILKLRRKINIPEHQYMFLMILLSFIPFYHPNADIFLLLIPFFAFDLDIFKRENFVFLFFIIFLIIEKAIILFNEELTGKILVNFFTIIIINIICIYNLLNKNKS